MSGNMNEKTRLNLAVSKSVKMRMERIKKMIDADSLTEVVRRSLIVFETIIAEQNQGNRIEVNRDGKNTELFFQ